MKNIVLIGFMGTGKTDVGNRVAERLGYRFIDSDSIIEKVAGKSINAIFREDGEETFRTLEANVIKDLSGSEKCVIATGGGAVMNSASLANLKSHGWLVWLKATPKTILERVSSETHRPLLNVAQPLEEIKRLLNIREILYAQADTYVETDKLGIEEISDIIVDRYKKLDHSIN